MTQNWLRENKAKWLKGGEGSGNFGHAGRVGLVGGSAKNTVNFNIKRDNSQVIFDKSGAMKYGESILSEGELTQNEINTIIDYKKNGYYRPINNRLRNRLNEHGTWDNEKVDEWISLLDSSIKKSKLPKDTVVYRGINSNRLEIGDTFTDKAFTSTTMYRKHAYSWTYRKSFKSGKYVVFEINLPKGSNALFADDRNLDNMGEFEFLLPHGLTYKIVGEYEDIYKDGHSSKKIPIRILQLEIINE